MKKIWLKLFRILPLPLLHLLAWPVGQLAYLLRNNQRHIAEVNLSLCFPDWTHQQRQRLVRHSMVETIKTLFESLKLWQAGSTNILRLVRNISGESLLREAMNDSGAIVIIPHLGNWEMIGLYCSEKYPVTSMYRTQKSQTLDNLMRHGREQFGAKLVPATQQGVRAQLAALKKKEIIMLLPDQNPGKGTGIFVPFFGITTNTPVLPVRLAQKTGAKIILAYAERLPLGRGYHLHFQEVDKTLYDEDIELATTAMNRELEQLIRENVQQYWWGYSRFRHRPKGEAQLYIKD